MVNTENTPGLAPQPISSAMLNQNVNVLSNAAELAIAVIASVDSTLIKKDTLGGEDLTLDVIRAAVFQRLENNLGIRS